jgi:hypothetical protein
VFISTDLLEMYFSWSSWIHSYAFRRKFGWILPLSGVPREGHATWGWRKPKIGDVWKTASLLWLWNWMVLVRQSIPQFFCSVIVYCIKSYCSFLLGFMCPLIWYIAALLYCCKYYNRDPRERPGLCASAFLVSFFSLSQHSSTKQIMPI